MERNVEVINGAVVIHLRPSDEERQLIEQLRTGMLELKDSRFDPKEEELEQKCSVLERHGFLKLNGMAWHLTYELGVNGYLLLGLPVPPGTEDQE